MTVLRAVLFLVLSTVGGYVGYYVGGWYTRLPDISRLIGQNQQIVLLSQAGFTVIGILIGWYSYSRLVIVITRMGAELREMPANDKISLGFGAVVGLVMSFLISPLFAQFEEPPLRIMLFLGTSIVLVFLTTQGATSMREELRKLLPPYGAVVREEETGLRDAKLLDTNIIIDGRISDIVRTGFLEGTIYVPGFVLDELQTIADSSDSLKRARGRRGLDILNAMQKEFSLIVRTYDHLAPKEGGDQVDAKLVRLAKALNGTVVTNDFNLHKVAELEGVRVLNVNNLTSALKPVVMAGEEMNVDIIKEGREPGQGIAYLEDGTMVVVEGGAVVVGERVDVLVNSVLQTTAGKMIFGKLKDQAYEEDDTMQRNMRTYSRDRPDRGPRRGGQRA